jgi:hypothetical protein
VGRGEERAVRRPCRRKAEAGASARRQWTKEEGTRCGGGGSRRVAAAPMDDEVALHGSEGGGSVLKQQQAGGPQSTMDRSLPSIQQQRAWPRGRRWKSWGVRDFGLLRWLFSLPVCYGVETHASPTSNSQQINGTPSVTKMTVVQICVAVVL